MSVPEVIQEKLNSDTLPETSEDGERRKGVVKHWNFEKGFGFIERADGQPDVFVHQSVIQCDPPGGFRALQEGQIVEYSLIPGKEGKQKASHVTGPAGALIPPPPRKTRHRNPWKAEAAYLKNYRTNGAYSDQSTYYDAYPFAAYSQVYAGYRPALQTAYPNVLTSKTSLAFQQYRPY